MSINLLDLGFAIVLLLFFVRGFLRGFIAEIAGLVGVFLGFFLAGQFYPKVTPYVPEVFNKYFGDGPRGALPGASVVDKITGPTVNDVIAYLVIFLATLVLVAIAAALLRKFMKFTFTTWLDTLLGGLVGGLKGALFCAVGLAVIGRFVRNSPFLSDSVLAGYIDTVSSYAGALLPSF